MNTFKKKSLYAALAGLSALGVDGRRASGVGQPGRSGSGPDLSVLHGRCDRRASPVSTPRTTRCCRSSTRRRRRRPSRSASSKARTAAKCSTSTCTCRRRTSGPPRSSRRRMAPASTRRTSPARCRRSRRARRRRRRSSTSPTRAATTTRRDTSLDRTREGYVEIIEMGDVIGSTARRCLTHVAGVPPCATLSTAASADTVAGTGGLFGTMTLINVLAGRRLRCRRDRAGRLLDDAAVVRAGRRSAEPGLVNPKTSVVVAGTNVYVTDWSPSRRTRSTRSPPC